MDRRTFVKGVAAAGVGSLAGPFTADLASAALPAGASSYVSLPAARLCDTRKSVNTGVTRLDSRTIRVVLNGRSGIPANATSVAVGVTAVDTVARGYITAYPAGQTRPVVSNINVGPSQIMQNTVVVKPGTGGAMDIYHHIGCHILVDLFGAFTPVTSAVGAGRYVPLAAPVRVLDTRFGPAVGAGQSVVGLAGAHVPAGASAAVVRLHCPVSLARGFFTVYEDGATRPEVSHMNCDAGLQVRSSQVIVPLSPTSWRQLRVYSHGGGHVVLEVVGYMTGANAAASTDGLFVPLNSPSRQVDTEKISGWNIVPRDWVAESPLPAGVTASAVVLNLGAASAIEPGYITAYPARTARPRISQMTAQTAGQVVSTHSWQRTSPSGVSLTSTGGARLFADMSGYFTGTPTPATTGYVGASGPAAPDAPYTLSIPRIGLTMSVVNGTVGVVDSGRGWIMPGSTRPGETGPLVIFAHRTSAGGPFRYINNLQGGDEITITDAWGRKWVYRKSAHYITGSSYESISNAVWRTPSPSISLVACSKADGTATSLTYRLVVNGTREFVLVP